MLITPQSTASAVRFTLLALFLTLACAVFSAASPDDPLYYMPDGKGYVAVNLPRARNSPGLQRVRRFLEESASVSSLISYPPTARTVYVVSHDTFFSTTGTWSMILTGQLGLARDLGTAFQEANAKQVTLDSHVVYTSGSLALMTVGTTGALLSDFDGIKEMTVDARSSPGAAAKNGGFQFVRSAVTSHSVAIATGAAPITTPLGNLLAQLPEAPGSIRDAAAKIAMISCLVDWDTQLSIAITFHIPDAASARVFAAGLNQFLQDSASATPPAHLHPALVNAVKGLRAETNIYGVTVRANIPTEAANNYLDSLEEQLSQLPEGPAQ